MPRALITGIAGQDGAYLSKWLLGHGYEVWGTLRDDKPLAQSPLHALGLVDSVHVVIADLRDRTSMDAAIRSCQPDEIYNLAAQSSVSRSFEFPVETGQTNGIGVASLLSTLRELAPSARVFQASSGEIFGDSPDVPQTEASQIRPKSPYGASKAYAYFMSGIYRQAFGAYVSSGILFNHESPLRPETFVTRKVTAAVARVYTGRQSELLMGNLDVERDWGFAWDYVQAMWLMLQQGQPEDYVLATGQTHSLREFVRLAFETVGLDYRRYVKTDPRFIRPAETNTQVGSPAKAGELLGWSPSTSFETLVQLMVEADLCRVNNDISAIRYTLEPDS